MKASPVGAASAVLPTSFFERDVETVARGLLGIRLLVGGVGGIIVETEAYDANDPASHSFAGVTARNAPMFGPPGRAYIYRIYGLHWCLNTVCSDRSPGSAVLIRAVEPTHGLDAMRVRRGVATDRLLCSGPGRLAQALGIDGALNGAPLDGAPFELMERDRIPEIATGGRIGISKAADTKWRFCVAGSSFLSRPRGR